MPPTPWRRRSVRSSCRTSADRSCSAAASCRSSRRWPERGRRARFDPTADEPPVITVSDGVAGAAVLALRHGGVDVDDAVFARVQTSLRLRCADLGCYDHAEVVLGGHGALGEDGAPQLVEAALALAQVGDLESVREDRPARVRRRRRREPPTPRAACSRPRLAGRRRAVRRATPSASTGPAGVEQPARPPRRRAATRPAPSVPPPRRSSAASPRRPSARATSASPRNAHALASWRSDDSYRAIARATVAAAVGQDGAEVVGQPTRRGRVEPRLPIATDDVGRRRAIRRRCGGSCPGAQQRPATAPDPVRSEESGNGVPASSNQARPDAVPAQPFQRSPTRARRQRSRPVAGRRRAPAARCHASSLLDRDELVDRRADVADGVVPLAAVAAPRRRRRSPRTPRSSSTRPAPASSRARTGSAPGRPGSRRTPRRRRGTATAASAARRGPCPTRTACGRVARAVETWAIPAPSPSTAAIHGRWSGGDVEEEVGGVDDGATGTSRRRRRRPERRRRAGRSGTRCGRPGWPGRGRGCPAVTATAALVHQYIGVAVSLRLRMRVSGEQHRRRPTASTGRPGTRRRGAAPTPTAAASARRRVPRRSPRAGCPSSSVSGHACRCSTRPRPRTTRCAGRGWPAGRPG